MVIFKGLAKLSNNHLYSCTAEFRSRNSGVGHNRCECNSNVPGSKIFSIRCKQSINGIPFFNSSNPLPSICMNYPLFKSVSALWYSLHKKNGHRRVVLCQAKEWTADQTPYETLGLNEDCTDDQIKYAYRSLVKVFHPDVYDGKVQLEQGETIESRFIHIQAAYELLIDSDERDNYDRSHRTNPMKASKAWMEWIMKKKKAYEQRGDMAISAWQEQQQRNMNLRARSLSKAKIDPEEERRLLAKERQANLQVFETTLKRHGLVLKKRDLLRRKAEENSRKKLAHDLLLSEGFEIVEED